MGIVRLACNGANGERYFGKPYVQNRFNPQVEAFGDQSTTRNVGRAGAQRLIGDRAGQLDTKGPGRLLGGAQSTPGAKAG